MRKTTRQFCLPILVLTLLLNALASAGNAQQLGHYLYSIGYRTTVWIDFNNIRKHDYGLFDPTVIGPAGFPGCSLAPNAACIDAFNRRWGTPDGGGRMVAPWRRKGDLVGERFSLDTLSAFFDKVGLAGSPTAIDREDAVLVAGAWDGLIAPSGAGIIEPPGVGDDGCADWFLQFQHWLESAPPPPSSGTELCTTWATEFERWITEAPAPAPIGCSAVR